MAIKDEYGASFRRQLHHFPVWDVGSAVGLGDYGVVSENCFTKLGNITDFDATLEVDAQEPPAAYYAFTSAGTRTVSGGAQATALGANASLEIHFESAFSLFVRADQSRVVSMANANRVGNQLRTAVGWKRAYCWVSSVRVARAFVLLMNTKRASSITLHGDPGALAATAGGKVSGNGSTTIQVTGDAGLNYLGGAGAIYVDLMRIGLFGGTGPMREGGEEGGDGAVVLSPDEDLGTSRPS